MKHCKDCGCKVYGGVCPNCNEELYIIKNQPEFINSPLSDEFISKAKEQRKKLRRKNES